MDRPRRWYIACHPMLARSNVFNQSTNRAGLSLNAKWCVSHQVNELKPLLEQYGVSMYAAQTQHVTPRTIPDAIASTKALTEHLFLPIGTCAVMTTMHNI